MGADGGASTGTDAKGEPLLTQSFCCSPGAAYLLLPGSYNTLLATVAILDVACVCVCARIGNPSTTGHMEVSRECVLGSEDRKNRRISSTLATRKPNTSNPMKPYSDVMETWKLSEISIIGLSHLFSNLARPGRHTQGTYMRLASMAIKQAINAEALSTPDQACSLCSSFQACASLAGCGRKLQAGFSGPVEAKGNPSTGS